LENRPYHFRKSPASFWKIVRIILENSPVILLNSPYPSARRKYERLFKNSCLPAQAGAAILLESLGAFFCAKASPND
jgi:hypothetical protein